jgi:Reverse transcriptase (RNA-dependent DNA polymerase)
VVSLNDVQFGFRPGRGTTYAIFIVRHIQERFLKKKRNFWMAFVDPEKAFDRIPREVVWWALRHLGVEEWLVTVSRAMYEGVTTAVKMKDGVSDGFEVKIGVHQSSIMCAFLAAGCTLLCSKFLSIFAVPRGSHSCCLVLFHAFSCKDFDRLILFCCFPFTFRSFWKNLATYCSCLQLVYDAIFTPCGSPLLVRLAGASVPRRLWYTACPGLVESMSSTRLAPHPARRLFSWDAVWPGAPRDLYSNSGHCY